MDTYKTISFSSEGIYKDKGSKFLSFAIPINTADEAKEIVKQYQKKFFDARHVCYAWMLGTERTDFRTNDDGEPSGTAGKPILGQINSRNLTNILIIVIRYFGGVLLGTGGLVVAYKKATSDALNKAEIIERVMEQSYEIRFNYRLMNDVMKIIKDSEAQITHQQFDNECIMKISIRKSISESTFGKLKKINCVIISEN